MKLYKWSVGVGAGVYIFAGPDGVGAAIEQAGGKWNMTVSIDGHRYKGERPTLEEAVKATSDLLFKHAKDAWLRMDAHAVTEPWQGDLK